MAQAILKQMSIISQTSLKLPLQHLAKNVQKIEDSKSYNSVEVRKND